MGKSAIKVAKAEVPEVLFTSIEEKVSSIAPSYKRGEMSIKKALRSHFDHVYQNMLSSHGRTSQQKRIADLASEDSNELISESLEIVKTWSEAKKVRVITSLKSIETEEDESYNDGASKDKDNEE